MNEQNTIRNSRQILEYANGQQLQSHHQPDHCVIVSDQSSFPPSSYNGVPPPSGNMNNFDFHHLPEHPGGPVFYGLTQYNQPNHPATNLELGVPQPSSYFGGHLNPPSGTTRVFRVPLNHGFVDQLPSSNNYRGNTVPFIEHGRGICKRKNAEHFGSTPGPSSSTTALMDSCHFDVGPSAVDAPLVYNDYRGIGTPPMMDVSSGVTPRPRSGAGGLQMDSGMVHDHNNYLAQGNYSGQSFQPSRCTWIEQQSLNNGSAFSWNGHNHMLPYFPGSNIHGSSFELGNAGLPRYPEASSSHGSANFLHSPPMVQQHHNLHPPQNLSGVRGYVTCYPPFAPAPSRVPPNDGIHHNPMHISPETAEPPVRPTGIRVYRPHGRSLMPDASSRRHDLPRLRTLQADRVELLEFPSFYEVDYDVDNFIDHHRDMRLDIDDMSYEELLALSERIGTVNTGLSEEDITCHLKTRSYSSSAGAINLEELPCLDQNNDSCIICQDEYEENDKLGILECGHEYHIECLKKWLFVKNVCPVCKSSALTTECKDR